MQAKLGSKEVGWGWGVGGGSGGWDSPGYLPKYPVCHNLSLIGRVLLSDSSTIMNITHTTGTSALNSYIIIQQWEGWKEVAPNFAEAANFCR